MNDEMERNDLGVMAQEPLPVQPEPVASEPVVSEQMAPVWVEQVSVEPVFFIKPVQKVFSRIGWALATILLAATAAQLLMIYVPYWLWGEDNWFNTTSWGMWITMLVPMYFVAMPLCILIMRGMPAERPRDGKLGVGNFFIFFCIFYFFTYCGNILGTILSAVLSGGTASNTVSELAMDNNPLKILVMVILAPLLEEYICRKLIIDRTRRYGEKLAVFLSGLTFGLLHGNLFQFFYAFAGGLLMGYIYIRTGRLRYTVLIHVIMNFMGSVVAPLILTAVDQELLATIDPSMPAEELAVIYQQIMPGLLAMMGYSLLLIGLSITGLVFFILKCKKLVWLPAEQQLPKGKCFKTVYLNAGMIVFILLCVLSMASSLLENVTTQKDFAKEEMQITLTSEFQEVEHEGVTVCYDSGSVAVFGLKHIYPSDAINRTYSEDRFAEQFVQNNGLMLTEEIKEVEGLTCFEFDAVNEETEATYHYFAVVYKVPGGFWLFQFVTEQDNFKNYRETIVTWAKSVSFE